MRKLKSLKAIHIILAMVIVVAVSAFGISKYQTTQYNEFFIAEYEGIEFYKNSYNVFAQYGARHQILADVEPESFEIIDSQTNPLYLKDKNSVFIFDYANAVSPVTLKIIQRADPKTFQQFRKYYPYFRDKNNVYYGDQIIIEGEEQSSQFKVHNVAAAMRRIMMRYLYSHRDISHSRQFGVVANLSEAR